MSSRQVVADTGPLLHLAEAQLLHLLRGVGQVHAPIEVAAELRQHDAIWTPPDWLRVEGVVEPHASEALAWQAAGLLDPGEAEAIALARQLRADWLLTDDAAARLFAGQLGLEAHGSLGILLWSAATGRLNLVEARSGLDRLTTSSLWISSRILAEAQIALDQIFD